MTTKQLDELFVKAVCNCIVHVKEFQSRYWHKDLPCPMLFGEFVTVLRREMVVLANINSELKNFCIGICCKDAWEDVARPKAPPRRGRQCKTQWDIDIVTLDGVWRMGHYKAVDLCKQAELQARYAGNDDSVEISVSLARFEAQLKEVNAAVGVVASLNKEADSVCLKLCEVAESLVA